ncbi:Transcriptional regulator, XRE [Bacillus cereus AH1273]|nr:Transcriptional regulator, XRE [Bacillus cereus AH1273]
MWWRRIKELHGYQIQQNILSQHYRILDTEDRRICHSFELDEIEKLFMEMAKASQ